MRCARGKLLLGYPGLRPTFNKRTGGVLNACLLDRTLWGQRMIFRPETRIIRRHWLGSSASNCPVSPSVLTWERFTVNGAVGCPAKQGADSTINKGLSQEWRGQNDFFMNNPYYTLCAQHTSALPPSGGREAREGVSLRSQPPSCAVFVCSFTGWRVGPMTSLPPPSSSVCRD